jgi:flagellum-specific peptidoglycan hydrolase FlgJ
LWAQWALETAQGRAMRGNNFGGIKASRGGALHPTTEGFGASRVRVLGRFRTYATPEEGARDHVALLARRFPLALEALRRSDAEAFVAALARGGYFTADPRAYQTGLERLAAGHAVPAPSGVAPSTLELVDGVLASLRVRERA